MEIYIDPVEFVRQYAEVIDVPDPEAVTETVWNLYRAMRTYDAVQAAIRAVRGDLGIDLATGANLDLLAALDSWYPDAMTHARFILQKHNLISGVMERTLSFP